jgi:hypothetical protein
MVNHRIKAERRLDAALENLLLAQDLAEGFPSDVTHRELRLALDEYEDASAVAAEWAVRPKTRAYLDC